LHLFAENLKGNFKLIVGICDMGYINSFYPIPLLTPKKSPENNHEIAKNKKISKQREPIEKIFGLLKVNFIFNF
jgi:hypothetical protein